VKEQDANIDSDRKFVIYVEKEDATYGPVEAGSIMLRDYFDDYLEKRKNLVDQCRQRLEADEISPVAYYAILINIGESDLACRVGVSRRALRKHMKPAGFARISLSLARRYAEVFDIPVANMFQILLPEGTTQVHYEKTQSPMVVLTHVSEGGE